MQKGLAMLQRVTGILPPEKVLDGEVRRLDDLAIAGGSSSDIWRALWLEEQPVIIFAPVVLIELTIDIGRSQRYEKR